MEAQRLLDLMKAVLHQSTQKPLIVTQQKKLGSWNVSFWFP